MNYIGKICDRHPGLEGMRSRWTSGKTVCVGCNADRMGTWRKKHPESKLAHKQLYESDAKYKRAKAIYRKTLRIHHKVRDWGDDGLWLRWFEEYKRVMASVKEPGIRHGMLKSFYNHLLASRSPAVVQSPPSTDPEE